MRLIDTIIVHCAATPNGKEFHAADIDRWHKERGFRKIGYHWVIDLDGTVHAGRQESEIGAHAEGHNADSIGICLIGTDKFTPAQWGALKSLVDEIKGCYPTAKSVIGHRDIPGVHKECPGFSVAFWLIKGPEREHIL
jgi:N-acetylmuramoyl-L-alanine amidase